MKISDLINEVKIFQNNYVRVDMAKKALEKLFPENTPNIMFDEVGMYIVLDNFAFRDYENGSLGAFSLSEDGIVDEIKNTKKYYLEFIKPVVSEEPAGDNAEAEEPTESEPQTEEQTTA